MTQEARDITAAAMDALGLTNMKMFAALAEHNAETLLKAGVSLADLRAVVEYAKRLIDAGDKSPMLYNLIFLWSEGAFPVLLRAAAEEWRANDPESNPAAFNLMMRGLMGYGPTVEDGA